jgi:eukaryotic-like serine/threonine-protein kinase
LLPAAAFDTIRRPMGGTVPAFPQQLDRYELLLPIGNGATATVYLARTKVVGDLYRNVAIKLVHPHLREELAAELIQEARVAAAIRHRHVVAVMEAAESPHGAYLALEYVEGETLAYLARRAPGGRLPLPIVGSLLGDMLDGLQAAHEQRDHDGAPTRLVHRDISLRNVLVGTDGMARLADFGVAKVVGRAGRTKTGFAKGTVPYMSPEQAVGDALDQRSDVWSAGVVAWELLTGRRLFPQEGEVATLLEIVGQRPIPMASSIRPELPAELDDALRSALTRNRERRCPDARELRRRLVGAIERCAHVASHDEVGALVAQLAGEKLDARARAVSSVLAARASEAAAQRQSLLDATESSAPDYPALAPNTTDSAALVTHSQPARVVRWWWASAPALAIPALIAVVAMRWPTGAERIELRPMRLRVPTAVAATAVEARGVPTLLVTADAPIAEIRIGDRPPLLVQPTRELTTELSPDEAGVALVVGARSVDGREASARASAPGEPVALRFAARPAAKAAVKKPRPGRGASPYER